MSDETHFLAAIKALPQDKAARLIYADWLEEQGDLRAELVRVEDEMRRIPIYSDRYWQLKPRRNALRRQCRSEWLEQMQYGTNYEPVFREVPDGWKERWRLLREFTERWHGFPTDDVGGELEAATKTEERLGRKLPTSIREWIAFCAELQRTSFADVLLQHDMVVIQNEFLRTPPALSLTFNRDGDIYSGVREEFLHQLDPPVNNLRLDYGSAPDNVLFDDGCVAPRVTSYVFELLHFSFPIDPPLTGAFMADVDLTPELQERLEGTFPVQSQFDGIRVFEDTNIMVLHLPRGYGGYRFPRLDVKVRKNLIPAEVPAFLWQYISPLGFCTWGMFIPEEFRRTASQPDIPF